MVRNVMTRAGAIAVGAALSAVAGTALAADPVQAPPPADPAPAYAPPPAAADWSGFYFGVLGSYLDGKVDTNVADPDVDGFAIGAIGGYNAQIDNWVLGVESDLSWTNADGARAGTTAEYNWLGSARARLGYAFDNVLVYGAGGLGVADLDLRTAGGADSKTLVGWTLGAGVEAMFTENVAGRLEYGYYDFGNETFALGAATSADANLHAVRAGLTYKFTY